MGTFTPPTKPSFARRTHNATDRHYGGSEIGQDARSHQAAHGDNGQPDHTIGGQQHGAVTGQRPGDDSLRGDNAQNQFAQSLSTDLTRVLQEWSTDPQWNETLNQLAQAVQFSGWNKALCESGLGEKLTVLNEHIEGLEEGKPQPEFRELSLLTEKIEDWQSEQSLSQILSQLQSSLSRLDDVLAQSTRRLRLDTVDNAIQQWRTEQSLAEAVLEQCFEDAHQASIHLEDRHPQLERLAQAIQQWKSEQQLSQALEQLSKRIVPGQLQKLAELIQQRQSEQSLLNYEVTHLFEELSNTLEQNLDQSQPSFERLDELALSLQNSHTRTVRSFFIYSV
jgi:hypothetical protein